MRGDRCASSECPVAWTEHNGGHWVISSYDTVAAAFRDWERFSSARTDPDRSAIAFTASKVPVCLPEESDPPEWYGYRRSLSRILSPQASERLRARARYWTAQCLDRVVERGECDFVHDLTCPVPAAVTLEWMGFPHEEWQMFSDAFHGVSAYPAGSAEHRQASEAYGPVMTRIAEELRDRIASPRDDALSAIAHHEIDGVRLSEEAALSIAFLTAAGGVDTTTSLTGAALLHLAQHPLDRERLRDGARPPPHRHRGVPPLLPAGAGARAHRRRRHGVRGRGDEAGRPRAPQRGRRRTATSRSSHTLTSSSSTAIRTATSRSESAFTVARDHTWPGWSSPR